jgi:hypothetical protein
MADNLSPTKFVMQLPNRLATFLSKAFCMQFVAAKLPFRPSRNSIRSAMRLASFNAFLWAVGNGLVSTQLVIYLANDFGAAGLAVSIILAAPRFVGMLRLGVPALIARLRRRKVVCVAGYLTSAMILLILPLIAMMRQHLTQRHALAALVLA